MKCINERFWFSLVLSIVLSGCASKGTEQAVTTGAEQVLQEHYRQAIDSMKLLESAQPKNIEAGALKDSDDLLSAHGQLKAIHEQKPFYPGPILNLGISAWWLGESDKAIAYMEQVLGLESVLDDALAANTISQAERDDIAENLEIYTLSALNYLGLVSREQGNFTKAEKCYRDALAIDDDDPTALRNLAILLDLYLGKVEEALPLYEQYQSLLDEPDPQVKDWIFDLKSRL